MMPDTSPFNDLLGIHLTEWSDGHAMAEMYVTPQHMNRSGWLHGGALCTLLDTVCSRAGCWSPTGKRIRSSTISLTINFSRATQAGLLTAVGTLRRGAGSSIFSATGEVLDAEGRLIALAQGTFKYRPGHTPKDAID
ncbi:PaaI family thioesterase [Pontitalea aquivivens]|uniref:PaaI family thioesterase n=1 Tax=Pontitalea aquivivens TaxID=3388663 RepID=UPI0039708365